MSLWFCLKILNPELQIGEIPYPEKPIGDHNREAWFAKIWTRMIKEVRKRERERESDIRSSECGIFVEKERDIYFYFINSPE